MSKHTPRRWKIIISLERQPPTPGPWKIGKITNCTQGLPDSLAVFPEATVKAKKRGAAICLVSPLPDVSMEDESNARLISAAPDLLEALKGVLRIADRETLEFDAARAAIAKAEGEAGNG